MKTTQVIGFVFATVVATGLLSAAPSYAKNLELQNQNKMEAHCAGAGNCRFGDNSTSRPTFSGMDRPGVSTLHGRASAGSFGAGGRPTSGGDSRRGGGSGGHAGSHGGHGSKR
jgi:hypothetical protein